MSKQIINCKDAKKHPNYNKEIDGGHDGPCLFVPYEIEAKVIWVVCLRGHLTLYTTSNELSLQSLIPFIAKSILGYSAMKPHTSFDLRLSSILKIIPIMCNSTNSLQDSLISTVHSSFQKCRLCCEAKTFLFNLVKNYTNNLIS